MTEQITTQGGASIVSIIQQAVAQGDIDPSALRELLAVRREWEADEARKAFNHALADFQKEAPIVEKADDAHGKKYAALDRIWRTVRPLLTEKGLSVTWHITAIQEGVCRIEGELSHRDGHSVTLKRDVPLPEIIRGQNAAQQAGSAETYGKRYALCAALGIVTGEDDDAMKCGQTISAKELTQIHEVLDAIESNKSKKERDKVLADLLEWAGVDSLEDLPAGKFKAAMRALDAKK